MLYEDLTFLETFEEKWAVSVLETKFEGVSPDPVNATRRCPMGWKSSHWTHDPSLDSRPKPPHVGHCHRSGPQSNMHHSAAHYLGCISQCNGRNSAAQ